jgi:UDP-N-acetylmuramyl pentapeptide phosphotransferase/UDP-N-acetylglucosamine-1-phosphate transferase
VVIAFGVFSVISITNEANLINDASFVINNAIVIVLALVSFPLLDTIRVFCIRLMQGKSPFLPDRNHLHHHLLKFKLSHIESTALVVIYTLIVTGIALALNTLDITKHFFSMLFLSSFVYLISWRSKRQLNNP